MAELTLGLILALDRRIVDSTVDLRAGKWDKSTYSVADGLLGKRIGIAGLGAIGLDVLRQEMPQVVITDINMPRMDGFGFIEAVRQDQAYRAVPILVLTTESDDEKKTRARRAGATGWIVKPFDPAKLIAAVRRVAA